MGKTEGEEERERRGQWGRLDENLARHLRSSPLQSSLSRQALSPSEDFASQHSTARALCPAALPQCV